MSLKEPGITFLPLKIDNIIVHNQGRSHKVIVTYHLKTSRIDFDKIISIYLKKCHIYFLFLFDLIWL